MYRSPDEPPTPGQLAEWEAEEAQMREAEVREAGEFCGSLQITEDGQLLPTRNRFGGVVDKFGVYRIPDETDSTDPDFYRDSEPGRRG